MALQITFKQMKIFAITIISLLIIWLVMGHFVWVKVERNNQLQQVNVDYYFLAPMNTKKAMFNYLITSEIPNSKVEYNYSWLNPFHLNITINEKNSPQGVEYRYSFKKSKALIPPFTVSKKGIIMTKVQPELITTTPQKNVPTKGPIILRFNTPILAKSLNEKAITKMGGHFSPVNNNYTQWQFIPEQKLQHQQTYIIKIGAGLQGVHGLKTDNVQEVKFSTAPEFKVTEIYPKDGDNSVWLSRNIKVTTNQPIKAAKISGLKGTTIVKDNTVLFVPERTFTPATDYKINVTITSIFSEVINKNLRFRTTNLGNKPWLEIKSGSPCRIWLMKGTKEIKKIEGWFTKDLEKLPRVTMYESSRDVGEVTKKTREKLPWIRLNTDIMLHSTNYTGKDDHNDLGIPHTYSCILLPSDVIAELYATLPKGFMVIVH